MNCFNVIFYCTLMYIVLSVAPIIGGIIAGALLIAATCTSVVALFRLSAYIRARKNAGMIFHHHARLMQCFLSLTCTCAVLYDRAGTAY